MSFVELVGTIIHNCGVLEFFTNNIIRALSTESEYARIIWLQFARRIRELRRLLRTKGLLTDDLISLLQEMRAIADDRNLVAHNPIASDGTSSYILLVQRTSTFPPDIDRLDSSWLQAMAERSLRARDTFLHLLPGARQFEPSSAT